MSEIDYPFFEDWRREQTKAFNELRREWSDTLTRIDLRLTGIESRMSESQLTLERHQLKIIEIDSQVTEVERRVDGLEKREVEDAIRRIRTLEEYQKAVEMRQVVERERMDQRSGGIVRSIVTTVVCTAAGSLVTAAMAFLGWLLVGYIKSTNQ